MGRYTIFLSSHSVRTCPMPQFFALAHFAPPHLELDWGVWSRQATVRQPSDPLVMRLSESAQQQVASSSRHSRNKDAPYNKVALGQHGSALVRANPHGA